MKAWVGIPVTCLKASPPCRTICTIRRNSLVNRRFESANTKVRQKNVLSSNFCSESPNITSPTNSDMDLTILGSSAGIPNLFMHLSSCLLRTVNHAWLFDCGDATARQLMKTTVRTSKIDHIFISHLHADHILGLPSAILGIHRARTDSGIDTVKNPIHIYGPAGLRPFVRTAIFTAHTKLNPKSYLIHEIVPQPNPYPSEKHHPTSHAEVAEERNYIAPNGILRIFSDDELTVTAVQISHSCTSWGFIVEEKPKAGRLRIERLEALKIPVGPIYGRIKSGECKFVELPDGTRIPSSEFIDKPLIGRKVVLLGDTRDARRIVDFAMNADLLLHEATLDWGQEKLAAQRGHSTAKMAAELADTIHAKVLVLTHFGGAVAKEYTEEETRNEKIAELIESVKTVFHNETVFAKDLMTINIERQEKRTFPNKITSA